MSAFMQLKSEPRGGRLHANKPHLQHIGGFTSGLPPQALHSGSHNCKQIVPFGPQTIVCIRFTPTEEVVITCISQPSGWVNTGLNIWLL